MLTDSDLRKPQMVSTGGAFSVSYQERLLYSRYNPKKLILSIIEKIKPRILPGTLILACSPCLWYGLEELIAVLPVNSLILGIEYDKALFDLEKRNLEKLKQKYPSITKKVLLVESLQLKEIPYLLQNKLLPSFLPKPGTFKRTIRIDFSAGIQFYKEKYTTLQIVIENAVAQFWKNRLTLVQFGRKYSSNIFLNLSHLPNSIPLELLHHSINKPLLIFGAGESLDTTLSQNINLQNFYTIAVDAALPCLLKRSITPDAVITMECQNAIIASFIGAAKKNILLISDMTGIIGNKKITKGFNCFFISLFDNTHFLTNLTYKHLLPEQFLPMGSIGLTAVETAILLRRNKQIPVFITGMDFSYTKGITHAKSTAAQMQRINNSNRLLPILNISASYSTGAQSFIGKNGKESFTTTALKGYAINFSHIFRDVPNIYDIGNSGIPLSIKNISEFIKTDEFQNIISNFTSNSSTQIISEKLKTYKENKKAKKLLSTSILNYLEDEKKALIQTRNILTHGHTIPEEQRNRQLCQLLSKREYLYLHFPDGYNFNCSPSFLKRVRIEIDFFLKIISRSKSQLSKLK